MAIAYFLTWVEGRVPGAGITPDGGVDAGLAGGGGGPAGGAAGLAAGMPGRAGAADLASALPFIGTFFSRAVWIWLQVETYTKICEPETRSSLSKISELITLEMATRSVLPILSSTTNWFCHIRSAGTAWMPSLLMRYLEASR